MKTRSADSLARDHTEEAVGVIHDIMLDPFAENKDRLRAAETLIDRGHGKAVSAVISVPVAKRVAAALATMSDEELLERIREEPLPRLINDPPPQYTCPVEDCPGDHASKYEFCGKVEDAVDPLLL
jgi:hypothetical protein